MFSPSGRVLGALILVMAAAAVTSAARAQTGSKAPVNLLAEGGNETRGFDMAPETRLEVVEAAAAALPTKMPAGPFEPTWDSLKANYRVPAWFTEAKFGLFMHWGLYAVPAYHNEWYEKHMYGQYIAWHREHFGPHDQFGYKDFIPKFTAEKFDPAAWAALFKKSGARFVIPTAQHHDNFALWDSAVTPFNAKQMGPKRDLIGDLAKAVRAQGLKFGVSNHGVENFQFINPPADLAAELKEKKADLYDPKWADFYNVADRSDAAAQRFLVNWFERNVELIDKYQPDMLWFDNGVDVRYLDPLKLRVAAYYYNRAKEWGKDVSLSTKKAAYAPSGTNTATIGSIIDFEKIGTRSPAGIRPGVWQVDEPIGSTWGYTSDMKIAGPGPIIAKLADTVSKNGTLLLNLSPRADGTIPDEQQATLLGIGEWLGVNGEAIYGTHHWRQFKDGDATTLASLDLRFTVKGNALYVIILGDWPIGEAEILALGLKYGDTGKIETITLLGHEGTLKYVRDAESLRVKLPAAAPGKYAYVLKITGLTMPAYEESASGNP
jgi:alpha-L-fucosidase